MFEFLRDEEKIGEGIAIGEARGIAVGEKRGIAIGEKRGIALGEKRGIAIGEERGIAVGEARTRDSIMKLLIADGMSPEKAAKITNMPLKAN